MNENNVRRASVILAGLSVLGGAMACETAQSPRAHRTPTPATSDITKKSGAEIFAAARDALAHASSVRIKGKMSGDDGVVSMNMRVGQGYSAGTMTIPIKKKRIAMEIRTKNGRLYLRSPQMLRVMGSDFLARQVGDRWFYTSDKKQLEQFGPFTDLTRFAALAEVESSIAKGDTRVVNGLPAITLKDSDEKIYVATSGKPYPLQITPDTGDDHLDFTEYDAPFTVKVPAHALNLDREVSA